MQRRENDLRVEADGAHKKKATTTQVADQTSFDDLHVELQALCLSHLALRDLSMFSRVSKRHHKIAQTLINNQSHSISQMIHWMGMVFCLTAKGKLYGRGDKTLVSSQLVFIKNMMAEIPLPTQQFDVDPNHWTEITLPTKGYIKHLAAGPEHLLILMRNGQLYGAGHSKNGELGSRKRSNISGDLRFNYFPSLTLLTEKKVKTIAAGTEHSLILCENGELSVCGVYQTNYSSPLNYDIVLKNQMKEICEKEQSEIKTIKARGHTSFVLFANGKLYALGDDAWGQLAINGNGSSMKEWSPVPIPGVVKQLECSSFYSCLLLDDHSLWWSGENLFAFPNNNDPTVAAEDVIQWEKLTFDEEIQQIASSPYHLVVLLKNGELYGCCAAKGEQSRVCYEFLPRVNLAGLNIYSCIEEDTCQLVGCCEESRKPWRKIEGLPESARVLNMHINDRLIVITTDVGVYFRGKLFEGHEIQDQFTQLNIPELDAQLEQRAEATLKM